MKTPSVYTKVSKEYPRKIAMRLEALEENKKNIKKVENNNNSNKK